MRQLEISRTERDGVPVLWIPTGGTPRCTLVFRVGGLDESPAHTGVNHFVQQLVLHVVGDGCALGGSARPLLTTFDAVGRPEQLAEFLEEVGERLSDLPTGHLSAERLVLTLEEAANDEWTTSDELTERRWGFTAAGRIVQPDRGLRTLTADDVCEWARSRFTRSVAALCWSGSEPPADLRIPLPDGPAPPLPVDLHESVSALPLAAIGEPGGLGISAVVPDDAAHVIACGILHERLEQLAQGTGPAGHHVHMTWRDDFAAHAHVVWSAALDDDPAASTGAAALAELVDPWPEEELHAAIERACHRTLDAFADPGSRHVILIDEARRLLVGRPTSSLAQRRAELEAVDRVTVDRARQTIQSTAYVLVDPAVPHPGAPFHEEADARPDIDDGQTQHYKSRGLLVVRKSRLAISTIGVSFSPPDEPPTVLRWDELVAATEEFDGRWVLAARSGHWLQLLPRGFYGTAGVRAALDAHVPHAIRLAPVGAHHVPSVAARVEADLTDRHRKRCTSELTNLPQFLQPDEQVLKLAMAALGLKLGLLVITDERTLHLYRAGLTTDIPHDYVTGLRIEHPSGVKLVIQTANDDVAFDGDFRSREFVALRDLLRQHTT